MQSVTNSRVSLTLKDVDNRSMLPLQFSLCKRQNNRICCFLCEDVILRLTLTIMEEQYEHVATDIRFTPLVALLCSQSIVYPPRCVALLLRLPLVLLQPLLDKTTIRPQHRKQLLLSLTVSPRFPAKCLLDGVARMTSLSRQFADVLVVDSMGRPEVLVLIHFKQLLTSVLNV